jgi:hypothetical protein
MPRSQTSEGSPSELRRPKPWPFDVAAYSPYLSVEAPPVDMKWEKRFLLMYVRGY